MPPFAASMASVASILGRAAAWPPSYLHRLPDDAFLHVETGNGARIDTSGRTTPRSLRHLPVLDADGLLDLPHLRDALAQLPNAGPWLAPEVRDTLIAKAKKLEATALTSTHKAAKGLPDWSLGYLSHLDRHEALGVAREDAHRSWSGDKMLGQRTADLVKGLKKSGSGKVAKAAREDDKLVSKLRKKAASFNARAGERLGTKVTLKALVHAHDRGTAAYDAANRPTVKSREQWGQGRVNAMLRLTASGKPDHPGYTGDNDLLPAGHPRATKKAETKPGSVTRPKSPVPAPSPAAPPKPAAKPKAAVKPPKNKAPLPKPAEKALDTSVLGTDPERTGGTPWPDIDMAWLASQVGDYDSTGIVARHDALLAGNVADGGVDAVPWRLDARITKDEMGEGDLAAGGKLAPDQGFETRTYQKIPVVVDRPKGTVQTGVGKDGEPWERTYQTDYGYVPSTLGGDDEELDVFLGPDPDAPTAFIAVQVDDEGAFDEFKAFLGYPDEDAARAAYVAHIPEQFLARFFAVPVALLQGMLGLEPEAVVKAQSKPRTSFGVGDNGKVHVRWPTKVYSDPSSPSEPDPPGDPASSASSTPAAPVAASAPASAPESGAAPESPGSVAMAMARRAKALASVSKAGATYSGAKALPPELAQHPALTAAPTDTYTNPDEVGGWVYVIDGGDAPDADPSWIAFVDTTGKALLWTSRDAEGGVNGVPYAFRRDDLIKPDADGRLPLIGWTASPADKPAKKMAIDVCPKCGTRMASTEEADGTHWSCPKCGAQFIDQPATAENIAELRDDGVQIQLDPDTLEAAAKAARAVQSMLPAGKAHAIHKLPIEGETAKDMDGGAMFFSPDDEWGDDPAALASFLDSLKVPWLAEYPDSMRARLELSKAGKVFVHNDAPGSVFVSSYGPPAGVDVLDPHPDAGDDEATAFQAKAKPRTQGPDADVPAHSRPPGEPPSQDADRGVAPALVDGSKAVAKGVDLTFIRIGKADAEEEQRFALGPVLIPDTVDLQGDKISAEEIEQSERRFMELYQNSGDQHEAAPDEIKGFHDSNPDLANGKIVIVESYIVRDDRGFALINGRQVKSGTWLMGSIYRDDALWAEVKSGAKTGYSIGGFARRTPIEGSAAAR
jgi:predicted RNA-binding Zn-ribbon protein involved in translation (DUF1610 family)